MANPRQRGVRAKPRQAACHSEVPREGEARRSCCPSDAGTRRQRTDPQGALSQRRLTALRDPQREPDAAVSSGAAGSCGFDEEPVAAAHSATRATYKPRHKTAQGEEDVRTLVVPVTLNWVTGIRLKYLSANRLQAPRQDTPFPQQRPLTDIGHASHSGVSSRAWAPWLWAVGPLKPFLTLPKTGILNWGRGAESGRFGAKMQGSIQ